MSKRNDTNTLSHTRWNCKYHIVFAPKYRRQIIYGKIKKDIGNILRTLCERKGIEILEAEACPDHIHMLIAVPPKYSIAYVMGYLKGKSALMIFDRYANLKYKYGIYKKSITRRYSIWSIKYKRVYRSIYRRETRNKEKEAILIAACKSGANGKSFGALWSAGR